MKRRSALSTAVLIALVACGGSEPAEQAGQAEEPAAAAEAAPAAEMGLTTPEWFQFDEAANTVNLTITAGATAENNYWNFNGYHGGAGEIVVPEGAQITLTLVNDDPAMAHSIGVDSRTGGFPASFTNPTPVFPGAMTEDATSLTDATLPGESEAISFTASRAGEYALVCYIPGHALTGMYLKFTVSASGEAGFRG